MFYLQFGDNETTLFTDGENYYQSITLKSFPCYHSINKRVTTEFEKQGYTNVKSKPKE